MANFITLNQLKKSVQSLLIKINDNKDYLDNKINLKANKFDIESNLSDGIKIGTIDDVDFYAPEPEVTEQSLYNILDNFSEYIQGSIPINVSDLTNDAGYITSYTETDPTVPAWAKDANKPTYTAAEVGALPDTTVIPEDKVFIATYNTTTYADTRTAYNAGKLIFAVYDDSTHGKLILPLTRRASTFFQFEGKYLNGRSSQTTLYLKSDGEWLLQSSSGDSVTYDAIISSGDSFIIRDSDSSGIMKYSSLTFGSSTAQYLANNGTWQDAITTSDVNSAIATAIGNINSFNISVVQSLPSSNIDTHTIYFVSNNGDTGNIYDEYMYINNNWEKLGTTNIDLSGYAQTTDLHAVAFSGDYADLNDAPTGLSGFDNDMNYIITETDPTVPAWAKAANKPTYTATEVGALPDSTTFVSSFNGSTGAITYTAPVTSVNGATGVVSLSASDVGAIATTAPAAGITSNDITNWNNKLSSYTETDPTVPAWAKAASKPTYTAAEVGATTTEDVNTIVASALENASDVFITNINIGYSSGDNEYWYSSTKSLAQIIDAYNNNKICYAIYSNKIYYLTKAQTNDVVFTHYSGNDYLDILKLTTSTTSNTDFHKQISLVDKLKTWSGSNNTEYNLIGTATSNANTSAVFVYNPGLISFAKTNDYGRLTLGSTSTPGVVRLYTSTNGASGYTDIKSAASGTTERTITFPDASGTVALTTDIPSVPSWALNSTKPSYTFSELTSHPTTLNDYGITDAYTKTEVDGLVSGVLHYKGTKATVSALPNSGNVTGDVWHITADGSEWAWDGSAWQELGTAIDLTGYLQSSDIAAWAKAANKPTYTASEVGALSSSTTYVSSFNGNTGAITYTAPVTSVNGQTGAVTISDSDEKLKTASGISEDFIYNPVLGNATTAAETKFYSDEFVYFLGTGQATLHIGYNSTRKGRLILNSGTNQYNTILVPGTVSGQTTLTLPSSSGTLALTSDIPSWAQASTKPSYTASEVGAASATHAHGNITSGGDITTTATIASGDRIVINDESASKVSNSSITFGSSTAQYLANNGTWQNVPTAYDDTALAARVTALEQIPWVTYYTGSTTPSNAQGNNGDLYFQTAQ